MKYRCLVGLILLSLLLESGCSLTQHEEKTSPNKGIPQTSEQSHKEWDTVYISDGSDGYKLYEKSASNGEKRLLVGEPVIDACQVEDWVYYLQMDKGISKIRIDGTGLQNLCSTDLLPELNANTQVKSANQDGFVDFQLTQLNQGDGNASGKSVVYRLNTATNKLEKVNESIQ